jgi:hypothetical protein
MKRKRKKKGKIKEIKKRGNPASNGLTHCGNASHVYIK